VYLARNRTTGGLFAVKVLADQLSGEDTIVARFLQEARTSAALSGHPNIVSIFDVGQFENTYYIIMQYVEGEDLTAYLKRCGKLPPEQAGRVVEQIAEALVFAHSHRIVHRDLKPSNIKVQSSGRVVVLDFGIAKAGDTPSQLTTAGQRVGTPYYMSPEHFATGACDGRSDLYSLGVVFFELLTGRRPFEGDSIQQIEAAHRSVPPPSPCRLEPSVPEAFGRIVLHLLEKRPEDRYQAASELMADIRQTIGTGAAGSAQAEPAPVAVLEQPPARKRMPAAALAMTGALILTVAAGLFFLAARTGGKEAAPRAGSVAASAEIDAGAVSNTDYKAFCDATGHPYPDAPPQDRNYFFAKPEGPVVNVTYKDAAAFASWAGKRLPSAPEWEKATRGAAKAAIAEWTSTPHTPSAADAECFRKLAGADPKGEWYVVKGDTRVAALPSEPRPRELMVGFRCVR
jgi:hypothetical protein